MRLGIGGRSAGGFSGSSLHYRPMAKMNLNGRSDWQSAFCFVIAALMLAVSPAALGQTSDTGLRSALPALVSVQHDDQEAGDHDADADHEQAHPQHDAESSEKAEGTHGQAEAGHGDHHDDPGLTSAHRLAVTAPPTWYRPVITSFAVLFVLAVTLGSVAILTKGPDPVDDHGHDDHGHDSHGHGHDHAHGHGHAH